MANAKGLLRMTVQRIWKQCAIQPHGVKKLKFSEDQRSAEKARDVVGCCLNRLERASVPSVNEKSRIQALDRYRPLPPSWARIPAR